MPTAPYIDIHTHRPHRTERYLLSYSIGIDPQPEQGSKFSVGIHPWAVEEVDVEAALRYIESAPAVAIGEIGLDFFRDIDKELQTELFIKQLDIAERRNLPVILHCVRAYNEVLNIIRGRNLPAVVFHSYIGSIEQTKTVIERGYYVSLSDMSLGSSRTVDALSVVPLSRLFAETDMGEGEPKSIVSVYEQVAEIKGVSVEELREQIWINYKRVFG